MVICLERGADLHMAQLMPLPLTCLLNDGNRTWHGEFSGEVSAACVVMQLLITLVREQSVDTTLSTCFIRATTAGSDVTTTLLVACRQRMSRNLRRLKCLTSSSTGA